jgi:hypothetical protein
MKRWMIAALGLSPLLGCVSDDGDSSIRMLNAQYLNPDCTVDTSKYVSQGSIDLDALTATRQSYVLSMNVEVNSASQRPLDVETVVINSGLGALDVNVTDVSYEYETNLPGVTLAEETAPISAVFRPGTSGASNVFVEALGSKAVKTLVENRAKIEAVEGQAIIVRSSIQLRGTLSTGSSVTSNLYAFPLRVYVPPVRYDPGSGCSIASYKPTGGVCRPGQAQSLCQPPPSP